MLRYRFYVLSGVGDAANMSTNALRCAIPTPVMVTRVRGKPVSHAERSGRRKSTKRMWNIRSMCRDIEWREVNEVQIPGNKIEPRWPFLDTLLQALLEPFGLTHYYTDTWGAYTRHLDPEQHTASKR